MKKIKSGIAVIMALVLAAGMLSGCGKKTDTKVAVTINETGFPIVNEKLEMKMMGITNAILCNWEENLFFTEMEAKTNWSGSTSWRSYRQISKTNRWPTI